MNAAHMTAFALLSCAGISEARAQTPPPAVSSPTPAQSVASPVVHSPAQAPALTWTCRLGQHPGVSDADAEAAARSVCDRLASQNPPPGSVLKVSFHRQAHDILMRLDHRDARGTNISSGTVALHGLHEAERVAVSLPTPLPARGPTPTAALARAGQPVPEDLPWDGEPVPSGFHLEWRPRLGVMATGGIVASLSVPFFAAALLLNARDHEDSTDTWFPLALAGGYLLVTGTATTLVGLVFQRRYVVSDFAYAQQRAPTRLSWANFQPAVAPGRATLQYGFAF
jgi:hypothetical protein